MCCALLAVPCLTISFFFFFNYRYISLTNIVRSMLWSMHCGGCILSDLVEDILNRVVVKVTGVTKLEECLFYGKPFEHVNKKSCESTNF